MTTRTERLAEAMTNAHWKESNPRTAIAIKVAGSIIPALIAAGLAWIAAKRLGQ